MIQSSQRGNCEAMQENTILEYCNTKEMCPELQSLDISLKLQEIESPDTLQNIVLEHFRDSILNTRQLASWAYNFLQELGARKDEVIRSFDGLDPNLLSYVGLGRRKFSRLQEDRGSHPILGSNRKMPAFQDLETRPKRIPLEWGREVTAPDIFLDTKDIHNLAEVETQSQVRS